ncbi:MAG: polysaccharide deacetylase family protein [Firmicutes bacterium]|nr:polysaccharide deacetylase family protein [Bacillota bacterium]
MRKINIFLIVFAILLITPVFYAFGENEEVKVPVLLYHNIMEKTDGENPLVTITPRVFREHMTALKNAGFEAITFDDFYNYAYNEAALPKKPIIISFDDGYESNYRYTYPILQELGIKATIFIVTETVGAIDGVNYPHFTWDEAKEMTESGLIDIQSHSHSHQDISLLSESEAVREIRLSKYLIETNLDKKCEVFAYPFGSVTDFAAQAVSEAGYKMQCRVGDSGYNIKNAVSQPLRRITVWGSWSADTLLDLINQNLQNGLE